MTLLVKAIDGRPSKGIITNTLVIFSILGYFYRGITVSTAKWIIATSKKFVYSNMKLWSNRLLRERIFVLTFKRIPNKKYICDIIK